jgi:hypothetical protein
MQRKARAGHVTGCRRGWACMDILDAEVLATLPDDILRPSVITQAIAIALEELSPRRQEEARDGLERELLTVRMECERVAEAIGRGGPRDRNGRSSWTRVNTFP